MKRRVVLWKKAGETPLAAVTRWKAAHPAYEGVPAAYAGRLDPMAEGKLLVLFGGECRRQAEYRRLDKEYEVEVLLGVGSDTGDALGIVRASAEEARPDAAAVRRALAEEEGARMRPYPAYSSKPVGGKPLFMHALEGNLGNIEIPEHEERIHRIRLLGMSELSAEALRARVGAFLANAPKSDEPSKALGADFRIGAVRASWDEALAEPRRHVVLRIRVACGSGTYMRSLAGRIGETLGTAALALSITRTRIGRRFAGFWLEPR